MSFKFLDNFGGKWEDVRESLRDDLLQFAAELAQLRNTGMLDGVKASDTAASPAATGSLVVGALPAGTASAKWTGLPIGANHQVLKSDGSNPSWGAVTLTSDISGVLPTANGGTSVNIASAALPLGSGQIQFPATQNPSAGANVLDDYEEGTWTPIDASGAGLTIASPVGFYIKVGRVVHITAIFVYPATVSGLAAKIGGLPFTCQTTQPAGGGHYVFTTTGRNDLIFCRENTTNIEIFNNAAAGITNAQMSGTSNIITGTYFASA